MRFILWKQKPSFKEMPFQVYYYVYFKSWYIKNQMFLLFFLLICPKQICKKLLQKQPIRETFTKTFSCRENR